MEKKGKVLSVAGIVVLAAHIAALVFILTGTSNRNTADESIARQYTNARVISEAFAEGKDTEVKLRGRDFVKLGKVTTVKGTLKTEFGEWFLTDKDGVVHEIHMGDHQHRRKTGIKLAEGKPAEVTGFLYKQKDSETVDIAVCTIRMNGEEYRFRNDDGSPLWRGSGSGEGEQAGKTEGAPREASPRRGQHRR